MVERFLAYSLRWGCPIRLVYMDEGAMKAQNVTVTRLDEGSVEFITARSRKKPRVLPLADIMAAGYARGDDGDTFRKTQAGQKGETDAD